MGPIRGSGAHYWPDEGVGGTFGPNSWGPGPVLGRIQAYSGDLGPNKGVGGLFWAPMQGYRGPFWA